MNSERSIAMIWDLDGTLADTEQAHFRAWKHLCSRFGLELTWDEFKPTFGLGNQDILRMLIPTALDNRDVEALSAEKEALFREESRNGVEAMPGARALALHLQQLGFPQAIGSSAPPENIVFILRALGMTDVFQATASRWEVANGKPFPDIFLLAATKLGAPPSRCVVLEDAPAGIQAAHAGGMRCIALASTWPEGALHDADRVVRDFSEICWELDTWSSFVDGVGQAP
jgi:beta-phosphoglucomutase